MSWKPEVDGIEERRRRAQELGGADAVKKQHELGRLTVRERIDALADPDSFREQGPLAGHADLDEHGNLHAFTPANYVLGIGRVEGRPCVIGGEDFTLRGARPRPPDCARASTPRISPSATGCPCCASCRAAAAA